MEIKPGEKRFLIVMAFLISIALIYGAIYNSSIKQNGVYVIGVAIEKVPLKIGEKVICEYSYKGAKYETSFQQIEPLVKTGDLVFFRISSKHPQFTQAIRDSVVASCFKITDMPIEGWKTFPTCK